MGLSVLLLVSTIALRALAPSALLFIVCLETFGTLLLIPMGLDGIFRPDDSDGRNSLDPLTRLRYEADLPTARFALEDEGTWACVCGTENRLDRSRPRRGCLQAQLPPTPKRTRVEPQWLPSRLSTSAFRLSGAWPGWCPKKGRVGSERRQSRIRAWIPDPRLSVRKPPIPHSPERSTRRRAASGSDPGVSGAGSRAGRGQASSAPPVGNQCSAVAFYGYAGSGSGPRVH